MYEKGYFQFLGDARYTKGFFFGISAAALRYISNLLFWDRQTLHNKGSKEAILQIICGKAHAF